ncbi:ABC transporter ATP-binding protein [Algiphilus sp.]|uniref:ABC transporter ATP-binding protein n=1 Tax=Algiphilus sp. TaxID=1872431 RepID=UPI003B51CA4D
MEILRADNLIKSFPSRGGEVRAVDGVSLRVRSGSCFGLLGPNGAGKSTTIEMLEGISRPSGGSIHYRGAPLDARYRERVGIQFQATALQENLTVRENLRFFSRLYRHRAALDSVVERCHLGAFLDRDTRRLSGGQRQRVLLGIALVNDPEILFLDEPTTGLDPQARRNFWSLIDDVIAAGKTVVLTTHYMDEAERLCDHLAIMDHGRVIAEGSPRALLDQHFGEVVLELPAGALNGTGEAIAHTVKGEWAEVVTDDVNATLSHLMQAGVPLAQLSVRPRTLEDLFLHLTGKALRA